MCYIYKHHTHTHTHVCAMVTRSHVFFSITHKCDTTGHSLNEVLFVVLGVRNLPVGRQGAQVLGNEVRRSVPRGSRPSVQVPGERGRGARSLYIIYVVHHHSTLRMEIYTLACVCTDGILFLTAATLKCLSQLTRAVATTISLSLLEVPCIMLKPLYEDVHTCACIP